MPRFSLLVLLAACGPPSERAVVLPVTFLIGDVEAACGDDVTAGLQPDPAQLADARLYLSDIELRASTGEWLTLPLDATSDWQTDRVVLLDAEDATGACSDSGTVETNLQVQGRIGDGTYDAIRFNVGLPFDLNHLDNATAPSPLNTQGMYWAWQAGYKSVRVDWVMADTPSTRFNVHLGATECASAGATVAPQEPCGRPNLPRITLDAFDPWADGLTVHLDELVAGSALDANTPSTPPGCMSDPLEGDDCVPVFDALGLDFDAGECAEDCDGQRVFTAQPSGMQGATP
ncbi:MAG: MbnP family copper-binding protein [Myxococcota bacterium]